MYTRFGSMGELRRAIRREGFARFRAHLDAVPVGDDPLTELLLPGLTDAYFGAQQCWTTGHGVVSLVLTGMITREEAERLSGEIWIALYERFATPR